VRAGGKVGTTGSKKAQSDATSVFIDRYKQLLSDERVQVGVVNDLARLSQQGHNITTNLWLYTHMLGAAQAARLAASALAKQSVTLPPLEVDRSHWHKQLAAHLPLRTLQPIAASHSDEHSHVGRKEDDDDADLDYMLLLAPPGTSGTKVRCRHLSGRAACVRHRTHRHSLLSDAPTKLNLTLMQCVRISHSPHPPPVRPAAATAAAAATQPTPAGGQRCGQRP
jgi:hypothetical protein